MNNSNLPVSEILKNHEVDEPKKRTREDWRKAKELEEARKAGTAPAAVDEEGKDINPHIPQYISSSPWYFGSKGPTLKHQRPQPEKERQFTLINEHFVRGLNGTRATRYRKGACQNCGAMTHLKKDCLERPRKVGARYTGDDIAADEIILPDLNLDFDGKRDRWNGFNPEAYQNIVDEFAKVEEAKRQLKEEKLKEDMMSSVAEKNKEGGSEDDEDKYADDADMPGTKVDSKQRITVRNLRIREDVAKYLRNLDPNSAYYDPKTRSMRDNPYKAAGKTAEELQFAGDNFVRFTGDTNEIAQLQMFAWQAHDKGVNVHLQADPTKAELLNKEFDVKKHEFKHHVKEGILDKYGGAEHLDAPPRELIFAQTEDYVEFSRHGEIIKGNEKPTVRSKYPEDVYNNNHLSVWGSFWCSGHWGYSCCHSMVKQSYCTGEAGKEANSMSQVTTLLGPENFPRSHNNEESHEEDEAQSDDGAQVPSTSASAAQTSRSLLEQHQEKLKSRAKETSSQKKKRKKKQRKAAKKASQKQEDDSSDSDSSSSSSEEVDSDDDSDEEERKKAKKLRKALHREEKHQREADELLKTDERKRAYNSMYEAKAPTEEEMEAYFMKRHRPEDPMALFLQPGTSRPP